MADLSDTEWLLAYRHLLGSLRERQMAHIAEEIEAAAARPVIAETTAEEEARVHAISSEVSRIALRPRMPAEAFAAAVEVLFARLVEVPEIALSVRTHLGSDVVFRSSQEDTVYAEGHGLEFSLDRLTVSAADLASIRREVAILTDATPPSASN
jgi:hypothetical protein